MHFALVADFPRVIPILAGWYRDDWSEANADHDPEDDFRGCAIRDRLPLCLVVLDQGEPVGTTFILETVDRDEPPLGPWFDGGYVVPHRRNKGVCLSMNIGSVALSYKMGFPRVFQGVRSEHAAKRYEDIGWSRIELPNAPDPSVLYLARETESLSLPDGWTWGW